MKLLRHRYDDAALTAAAERALGAEPTVDLARLTIGSENGVVTLGGQVRGSLAHRHVLDAVSQAYKQGRLKHERIVDEIVER